MKKYDWVYWIPICAGVVGLAAVAAMLGENKGHYRGTQQVQAQAIRLGYAQFILTKNSDLPKFQWVRIGIPKYLEPPIVMEQ